MKNVKIVMAFILTVALLTGCWGSSFESYMAGRTMYYGLVETLQPSTIERMENRFDALLEETQGVAMVEPTQTMAMFNDQLVIASSEVENSYGLIGDLAFLMEEAGAEFNETGEMTYVRPMPRGVFLAFSRGWLNSKAEYQGRK